MWNEFKRQVFGCKPKKKAEKKQKHIDTQDIAWQKEHRRLLKEKFKL